MNKNRSFQLMTSCKNEIYIILPPKELIQWKKKMKKKIKKQKK